MAEDLSYFAEYVYENEIIQNYFRIPRRLVCDRSNPIEKLDDQLFIERYRLSKRTVILVCDEIKHLLPSYNTRRNHPISPLLQLLITLRFYATGNFYHEVGDLTSTSKSSVCRIIKTVSKALGSLSKKYIAFPSTMLEYRKVIKKFYDIAKFPGVIGAIDCTHIPISSPGTNAELFRNRKGYFSINTQVVSDANLLIRNLVARWAGSVHDSTIFNNSELCLKFENRVPPVTCYLLGDGGYPCKPYLMTPLLNPTTNTEVKYNAAHIKTRNTVERLFGIWKSRFPCLRFGLRTKLETSLVIIVATGVLHNIAILCKDDSLVLDMVIQPEECNGDDARDWTVQGGTAVRNTLIQAFNE
ncbi:putative nuclease HARBI1 [Centruroides sculpturatus]|uniref:putative nuclease HARBI1 n=1 Tax=Centruroides sculpturatus TaxID=218467 RepID=UPI000C6CD842|nr:putative nuclease HARBI1 [Centruroides sculpturatus]